jgi:septal ring factor EnvC (AmiA/AmiB activator)
MRASFSDTHLSATRRRSLTLATVLLAALCVLSLSEASAPAQDLQAELQRTQGKLAQVHESQAAAAASLAEENSAINSMIGEVSDLRQRQAAVEAELSAKQDELDQATAELEKEQRHLEEVRAQLSRALGVLRERLVAIYESGSPDVLNSILESSSWSDLEAQTEYLNKIQSYDDSVVGRVKALRNEVRDSVQRLAAARTKIESARDEIAATERQVAAARAEAEARFAELKEAQVQRRQTMEALESREQALSDNLASISSQMAAEGAPAPTGEAPAPLTPGETAGFISESKASAPASAPAAIKDAISAANSIATTPYIWGGGHGSFEDSGYDCSGATSFALHGGGFLESPLDSTGLETWGEPGPGKWITVYANAEHAWMMIAGLAFDTVGGPGPRWHSSPVDSPEGFIARHPPGY